MLYFAVSYLIRCWKTVSFPGILKFWTQKSWFRLDFYQYDVEDDLEIVFLQLTSYVAFFF